MQYKPADILACHSNSFISKFIRFLTKSKYSHLAIIINENEIVEADGIVGHIRYRNISDYKNYADVYSCDLTDEQIYVNMLSQKLVKNMIIICCL